MSNTELKIERWRYPRFFTGDISADSSEAVITGEDARHISVVLRMRQGDLAVICDGRGTDHLAKLAESGKDECVFNILESSSNEAEPNIHLRLFQAMPKSDKMEFIVQKAVECGASEVIPFFSKRCVSRPDEKQMAKKLERYRRIALEAAKQCGRGVIPEVGEAVEFSQLIKQNVSAHDHNTDTDRTKILFYECASDPVSEAVKDFKKNIDIVIGSEGGFEENEASVLVDAGFTAVSLGKRILRCETAPIAAISILMNLTGNM